MKSIKGGGKGDNFKVIKVHGSDRNIVLVVS